MVYTNKTKTKMFVTYKRSAETLSVDFIPERLQEEYLTIVVDSGQELNDSDMVYIISVVPVMA